MAISSQKKNSYDRTVREISYSSGKFKISEPKRFSDYQDKENIILLGEPGIGKTYLFKHYENFHNAKMYTAINFISMYKAKFSADEIIYIDGLDEIQNIRALLINLQNFRVKKVRISCRASDWSVNHTLEYFQPYASNFFILYLEALSYEEQIETIRYIKGSSDPVDFINQATSRGIKTFLENPLTLTMLYQTIEKEKAWPRTQKELFEKSVNVLLKEYNNIYLNPDIRKYTEDELNDFAGAICAVRLISNIGGVSLKSNNQNYPTYPTYRKFISLFSDVNEIKIISTLYRRIFISLPEGNVDYIHRSIAEYLAASWITKQICNNLPISRILALITTDEHAVSSLRGLYAWLVVFLPVQIANQFIDKDPYCVLMYVDMASLCFSKRKKLINSLRKLSSNNPSFHTNWGTHNFGSLSHRELEEDFKEILKIEERNSLKYIVLSALTVNPIKGLNNQLFEIFENHLTDSHYRALAFKALVKISESFEDLTKDIYKKYKKLGKSKEDITFRSLIIVELYEKIFSADDLLTLIRDGLNLNEKLPPAIFWQLHSHISFEDIKIILNNLIKDFEVTRNPKIDFEICSVFDAMIERSIYLNKEKRNDFFGRDLWEWLKVRANNYSFMNTQHTEKIRKVLSECPELIEKMIDISLDSLEIAADRKFSIFYSLPRMLFCTIDEVFVLENIVCRVLSSKDTRDKQIFLYEIALLTVFNINQSKNFFPIFEKLYEFCDGKENFEDFLAVRERCCLCEIDKKEKYAPGYDTHKKWEEKTMQDRKKATENQKILIADFEKNKKLIQNGQHQGWLELITQIYFGFLPDSDKKSTPHGRLEQNLGRENSLIALEGLLNCPQNKEIPSLQEIIFTKIENKPIPLWWFVIIASLKEKYEENIDLTIFCEDLIIAAFAIDLIHPIYYYKYDPITNVETTLEHEWKNSLLKAYPEIAKNIYLAFAEASLKEKDSHNPALSEILTKDIFRPFVPKIVIDLLQKFPETPIYLMRNILRTGLEFEEIYNNLLLISLNNLEKIHISPLDKDREELWLISAYFISPQEFEDKFQKYALNPNNASIVWSIRDIFFYKIKNKNKSLLESKFTQIECFCRIVATHYKNCSPTIGIAFTGDRNPWDASIFMQTLLYYLSVNFTEESTKVLKSLSKDGIMKTYLHEIKHFLALNLEKSREKKYQQPTLDGVIETLSNRIPETMPDFLALVIDHLEDIKKHISSGTTDSYKAFWNLTSKEKIKRGECRPENTCRDILVDHLKPRLLKFGIDISPESHQSHDKRSDIVVSLKGKKIMIELKCDHNREIWKGAETQLEKYTHDPDCNGYGIYGIFWFGEKRGNDKRIRKSPTTRMIPQSPKEMEDMLNALIPAEKKPIRKVFVIDVSGDFY